MNARAEWGTVFETGWDFFREVYLLTGLRDLASNEGGEDRDEVRRKWREAACEAWHRLGAQWLAEYHGKNEPWALTEFGAP